MLDEPDPEAQNMVLLSRTTFHRSKVLVAMLNLNHELTMETSTVSSASKRAL